MKIQSLDKDMHDLLKSGYYNIPRFQRPYEWERQNIEDFWNDVVVDSDSDYFIGSMVLFKIDPHSFGIVDGQQRITTVTMFLCAIRNLLNAEGYKDLAMGIHNLIERPDINNKNRFVLHTETSYPYLQEYIQKFGTPEIEPQATDEERSLKIAYDLIISYLDNSIESIRNDPTITEDDRSKKINSKLISIRDKILNLKIIYIDLDNEDDAYIIFETLNTRGKDLRAADLVKAHLTKLLKPRSHGVDLPRNKWNAMVSMIEASQTDLDMDSFIHHFWLSNREYLPSKKLFKSLKKKIKKDNAKEFLEILIKESKIYRIINEPSFGKWEKHETDLFDSLNALIIFRVKQDLPMILSLFCEYDNNQIKLKHIKTCLSSIENFHFIFNAIASQRSSGGISQMYASYARRLRKASTTVDKLSVLDELKAKIKDKLPEYEEFKVNFMKLMYSSKFTKQKALVQYVLKAIHKYYNAGAGVPANFELMTIEHICPESEVRKGNISEESMSNIGNLLFVSSQLNSKLQDKTFTEKKKILKASNIMLDPILLQATQWRQKEIEKRALEFARISYSDIWKI